jgi:hypothetical protein
MTVAATDGFSGPYVLNGSTLAFPFDFDTGSPDEVQVLIDGVIVGTGFTVAVNGNQAASPGGTVTFSSPPSGSSLIIASDPDFAQQVGFTDSGPFLAPTHDEALDQAARRDIALRRDIDQTIRVPLGTNPPTYEELLALLAAGRPGSNIMSIPSYQTAGGEPIDEGTNLVRTASFYSDGDIGGAFYVFDPLVDDLWNTAHESAGFVDPNGRGFRLLGEAGGVTPFMFGARDCTGHPKLSDEVVYDCSDALDAMWNYVQYLSTRNIAVTMDCRGGRGLGQSRTWDLHGDDVNAIWNKPYFNIWPGRHVAMSRMVDLISVQGGNFQNLGSAWEVWGGTDTQLNGGNYGTRLIENGMRVFGIAGSRMGDLFCQGAQRWAVTYDGSTDPGNNNIPTQWGRVIAIQCGTRNTDTVRFAGTYTGTWLNHPADNGNSGQRAQLVLDVPIGVDPNLLRGGDLLDLGTPGAGYAGGEYPVTVQSIDAVGANSVTVSVYPYPPVQSGGTYLAMFGGGVDLQGGNCANNSFELIETYSCGVGVRYATLFSPKIGSLLTEATLCSVQLGFFGGESMQGISIEHFHFESVFWSIIDYAVAFGADFNVASAQPGFDKMLRLVPNSISGSTWIDGGPYELRGVSFHIDGEAVHMRGSCTKGRDMGGLTNHGALGLGNAPDNDLIETIYTTSGFAIGLIVTQALANKAMTKRTVRFRAYGDGPGRAPTEAITFAPVYYQPAITVTGPDGVAGASVSIAPGVGMLDIDCTYEPPADNSDDGNWNIAWGRMPSDVVVTIAGDTFTGLEVLPLDPMSLSPDWYVEMGRSAIYQDTGTATPATDVDHPLGRISDLSGNNRHLTQGTVGSKPKLKKVGPLLYAQADGADDFMQTPSFTRAQPFTWVFAGLANTDLAGSSTLLGASGSVAALQVRANQWRWGTGGGLVLADGRDKRGHTLMAVFNGASSKLFMDGQLIASGDVSTSGVGGVMTLFSNDGSGEFVEGIAFAEGCLPGDQSANAAGLHAWFAALMN